MSLPGARLGCSVYRGHEDMRCAAIARYGGQACLFPMHKAYMQPSNHRANCETHYATCPHFEWVAREQCALLVWSTSVLEKPCGA
jgi:hypothetical protein